MVILELHPELLGRGGLGGGRSFFEELSLFCYSDGII
jgi:hypothetical protein